MPTLYIANKNYSSWSLRPWVLMTQLGIAFDERLIPFEPGHDGVQFRALSPNGKVPCLVDGGTVVWDSLAITEYLAERHPGVWPTDPLARAWARCAAAEMHSGFQTLRNICTMNCGLRIKLHEISPALARDVARIDALWSEGLQRFGGPYLAGAAFTAADAFFAPVVFRVQSYGLQLSAPARAWVDRMLALPAMKSWYEAGIAETWREAAHEAEAQSVGTILHDLRRV